jgi:hypothetical protein
VQDGARQDLSGQDRTFVKNLSEQIILALIIHPSSYHHQKNRHINRFKRSTKIDIISSDNQHHYLVTSLLVFSYHYTLIFSYSLEQEHCVDYVFGFGAAKNILFDCIKEYNR